VLGNIYGQNNTWGQKSETIKTPSIFSQLAGSVLGAAGTALGGSIGGMVSSGIRSLFAPKTTGTRGTGSYGLWSLGLSGAGSYGLL
jgi:hypothetical protein